MLVGLIGWRDAKGRVLGGPGSEGMAEVEVFGVAMLMGGIPQVQSGEGLLPKAPTIRPCLVRPKEGATGCQWLAGPCLRRDL